MLNVFPTSCTFIFVVDSAVSTVTVKSYDESSWEVTDKSRTVGRYWKLLDSRWKITRFGGPLCISVYDSVTHVHSSL